MCNRPKNVNLFNDYRLKLKENACSNQNQFLHSLQLEDFTIFFHISFLCFWAIFPVYQLSSSTDLLEAKEKEKNWGHNLSHHSIYCRRSILQFQEDTQSYYTHLPVMMPTNYEGKKKCAHKEWGQILRKLQKGMSKVYSKVHSLELYRGLCNFVPHETLCKSSFVNQLLSSKTYGSLQSVWWNLAVISIYN